MKSLKLLLTVLVLLCLCACAGADEIWTATDLSPATADMPLAEDITQEVLINGSLDKGHLNRMRDGNYRSIWESPTHYKVPELMIIPPEGKAAGGLMIKWRSIETLKTEIQVRNAAGEWETVAYGGDDFLAQYIPLPNITEEFRIIAGEPGRRLQISEIIVMTPGRLPHDFQLWQHAPEKVDMMQIVGHPDDELLWFGGLLPTYAGELDKEVLVVCSSYRNFHRRLEMLDGLWTAGVTNYPLFPRLPDLLTNNMEEVLDFWGRNTAYQTIAELLRKYKPDVLVLQDEKGEYGHGVHRAITYVSKRAVPLAADASYDPETALRYGLWDVPKVYIHLYAENQIKMDWKKPLTAFDGKTGLEVATEAFRKHVTQQGHWDVWDGGKWDNSLFGLWHTTVGADVVGGDMFENIDKLYAGD